MKNREAVMDSANIGKIVVEVTKILKNNSPRKWYEPNILDVLKEKEVLTRVASKAENLRKEASNKRLEIVRKLLQEKPDDYRG